MFPPDALRRYAQGPEVVSPELWGDPMAEWKMLVTIVHEGIYVDTMGVKSPKQTFSPTEIQDIKEAFADFAKHLRVPLDSIGVSEGMFKPVFEFVEVKDVLTWQARKEDSYGRVPEHSQLVAEFPGWAVKQSPSDAEKWFEHLVWADTLCFVYPRPPLPPGVGMILADATCIWLEGKPLVGTISVPREPGKVNRKHLGDILVHEWLHVVDSFLRAAHGARSINGVDGVAGEFLVDSWQDFDPTSTDPDKQCKTTSRTIEMLRPHPTHSGTDDIRPRHLCNRGDTTTWDPHLLGTYLHDTVFDGARNNVIPKVTRTVPPPTPGDPAPPDKVYAGYDWDKEDFLLLMYQDQIRRTKPADWKSNLGRSSAKLTLDGPIFGGEPGDFTEVERVAITALLTHLPPEVLKVLSSDGSIRIIKGERSEATVRQSSFLDASTVIIDKSNVPSTPLDLQKAVLFELARVYLRKRVGGSKVRDQLKRFPWSIAKGLPFWGRVEEDFAREWARLTPWKVRDRECTPGLFVLSLLFELIGWSEPDGFWGHADFGGWVGLKYDDTSTFATQTPPRDVYDDFADAVVVYVFGADAYAQEGYFKKTSNALAPGKYDFIRDKVMAGRQYKERQVPAPVVAPVTPTASGGFTTKAEPWHPLSEIDGGMAPPIEASPHEFFATPYRLRHSPGGMPAPDPAMVKALAHWDRAREGSPLHTLEEVQRILRAIPKEEPVEDMAGMLRLFAAHGSGLLAPGELKALARLDVLILADQRLAIVVSVDAAGAVTECIISDPAASLLLTRETTLDPRLVRYVWRPSSEPRRWKAGEGAGTVDLDAAMRYLLRTCFTEKDAKYGYEPRTMPGAALLLIRELLHPAGIELPRGSEADPLAALHAFCETHGRGLEKLGKDVRPGDLVWFTGGGGVGIIDRVGEDGTIRSVIAGGAKLPDGRSGLVPLMPVDAGVIRYVWRPSLTPRRWTASGEVAAPLFAGVDAALNHLVAKVGHEEIIRERSEVSGKEIGTVAMLALLVDGGGSELARAAFAELPLGGTDEDFRRVVADRGRGVVPAPLMSALPRGAFVWFHNAHVKGEAPVGAVAIDMRDGLPTKLVVPGARLGRTPALALYDGPVARAELRSVWLPSAEPRTFAADGNAAFASFYGRIDEALRRVLRYIGWSSVSDESGTERYFANPISLAQLLSRDAPEGLRGALFELGSDTSAPQWRMEQFARLLDTWGEGLLAPEPAALVPGMFVLLRDRRGAVLLSVDAGAGTLEALVSGPALAHVPALPISSIEHAWRPSGVPRAWARREEVSPEYLNIDALLNRLRRNEGAKELNTQYVNTPSGLIDSVLFLESEFVTPALKSALKEVAWNDSGTLGLLRLAEMHGQGVRALGEGPVRVGDFLFQEQNLGLTLRVEQGRPVQAMWTGRVLQRGPVEAARVTGVWTPSGTRRVWARAGEPVSLAYSNVNRFLDYLVGHLGLQQLGGGLTVNTPCGFVSGLVLKSDALSAAVRQRLEQGIPYFSDPARVCWQCLSKLGKGLEDYSGQPLAPGDLVRTKGDELAVVASTREDGGPVRAIRTQHRITLGHLEAEEIASFWRPAP
ncbi:hypothetical protein [Hyalangium rubrum]|uniref:Uncharacterized protein n=1 Tax=Hyalangium rubrum TaxID=3103134 RepID=A0ABU5HEI4_9BACT|nr:hypothetical protein [Hyalangium sp. s54d21]MDY7231207.1 hypothetical protein [Hyalangium sp. s54d21]